MEIILIVLPTREARVPQTQKIKVNSIIIDHINSLSDFDRIYIMESILSKISFYVAQYFPYVATTQK